MEPNDVTVIFRNAAPQGGGPPSNQVSQQNIELAGTVTTAWIINARPNAATLVFDRRYFTQLPQIAPFELRVDRDRVQRLDLEHAYQGANPQITVKYEVRFAPNPNENSFGHAGHHLLEKDKPDHDSSHPHGLSIGDDPSIVIG